MLKQTADPLARPHVVVIGAGITGLAAAARIGEVAGEGVRVTVLESSQRVGGKVRLTEVGGVEVDEGAESVLWRRPEAGELIRSVGLGGDLVHPAAVGASVWTQAGLRPLPRGTLMGIPGDLRALAASQVLSTAALLRVPLDRVLPRTLVGDDIAIGRYVAARLGRQVVERLVEPLLGGVYAGHADQLSLAAALPMLINPARYCPSLLAITERRAPKPPPGEAPQPVFASIRGGLGRLPEAVAKASGADVRTRTTVRELRRTWTGWQVVVGPATHPEVIEADAVVLTAPAPASSRLVSTAVPAAATELAKIEYASVGIVTYLFPRAAWDCVPVGTGFLVPPVDRRVAKAATFSSFKYRWLVEEHPDVVVVRASVGRHGEEADLQRDDDDLAWAALADLQTATGVRDAPLATRVTRWGGALPQYAVGHLGRVARIRDAVDEAPGLEIAGAALDGVGIPACIKGGRTAADAALAGLAPRRAGRF